MTINQSSIQSERGQVDQSSYRECHTKINSLKNQVRKGLIPKATYEEEALNVMRVERTNGKVTLYHATPITNYEKISTSEKLGLKPPSKTGEKTLRITLEEKSHSIKDRKKREKIYLATLRKAIHLAQSIQNTTGDEALVLEVSVDEVGLRPDEDTTEENWVDSIVSPIETCSFEGDINQFKVIARTKPQLSDEEKKKFFIRSIQAESIAEESLIAAEYAAALLAVQKRNTILVNKLNLNKESIEEI